MLFLDGIIFDIQPHGGISALFYELLKRINADFIDDYQLGLYSGNCSEFNVFEFKHHTFKKRLLERYRDVPIGSSGAIFHSSYYRLPNARVPVVTTVYDFTYERYATPLKKQIHSIQKKRAIRASEKIICISNSTKKDLLNYLPDIQEDRIEVVHCGVSDDYFPLDDKPLGSPYVLFVGARQGYKNFSAVVQALSFIPDINILCVGGGYFNKNELEFLNKFLPGRYMHSGFVDNLELNRLYNGAVCLAYPSLYEGFGIPVVEAMKAGCPVIGVSSSSIPEVAEESAFLIDSGSVDELRYALEFFLIEENRKDFINRGLQQAIKFSWDKTYNKTRDIYRELSDY